MTKLKIGSLKLSINFKIEDYICKTVLCHHYTLNGPDFALKVILIIKSDWYNVRCQ